MGTVKRVHHCAHWGAHWLLVEDGRLVGVEPHEDDDAPSDMINAMGRWLDPSRRIMAPMVREGWLRDRGASDGSRRGREEFVEVSWDEALDLVSREIVRVREAHGNNAIFAGCYGWASSGRFHHASSQVHRLLNLAGGYVGHRDTYSLAAGPVIIRHTLGDEKAVYGGANTYENIIENADTVLVFGAISPRTAQIDSGGIDKRRLQGYLRRLTDRGVRVILVSPTREDLPEWMQVEWVPIRPNTDTALMLALAHEIVAAGAHDSGFLARYCSGADEFLDYLAGKPDGLPKSAEWAAAITDVPAETIHAIARQLTQTRSMITVSWSLQRADHGEQPYWAALSLAAIIGQIGLPGGGVGYGYGSTGALGAAISSLKSPAFDQLKRPGNDYIPVARIADMLLNPGAPYEYDGQSRTYPDIKMVYWAGGNPYHHHQDLNRLEEAWARPETVVVQEIVWTATARRADIVLPATSTLERNDIAGTGRLQSIIAMQQAVAPLGKSRTDYDICSALAERLGVGEAFTEGRSEMDWIRHLYEISRSDAKKRFDYEMLPFEQFWERGMAPIPVETNHTFLADFRADPDAHPLRTESGRIVLTSEKLRGLAYDDCPAHASWLEPHEWLGSARAEPDMLHLLSQQPRTRLHSQLDYAEVSAKNKRDGHEIIDLNPEDAATRGIGAGDLVRVHNGRGACLASARLTTGLRRGVAILPTGAWYTPSTEEPELELAGNPNVLTADRPASRFSQGCAAQTCMVKVTRVA